MPYLSLAIKCSPETTELLIAELSAIEYDSFWENETGFEAYIEKDNFDEQQLQTILKRYKDQGETSYTLQKVEDKNWNVEWETHFEPIIVEQECLVRATFHQIKEQYPYEIIINPKMSFGTGHHATTYLMLQWQLTLDQQGKRVMDAGCGTGILSVMAAKRGASHILAFDNNEWAIENSRENFEINHCSHISSFLGTVEAVEPHPAYDMILANINRNVLLEEIVLYAERLTLTGLLLLSGFYEQDMRLIVEEAQRQKLALRGKKERNDWVALLFSAA